MSSDQPTELTFSIKDGKTSFITKKQCRTANCTVYLIKSVDSILWF